MSEPIVNWIKNDPLKFNTFADGSVFLVALQVGKQGKDFRWEYDVVEFDCDGDGASLYYREKSAPYDAWTWDDFEYFALLKGDMPYFEERDEP